MPVQQCDQAQSRIEYDGMADKEASTLRAQLAEVTRERHAFKKDAERWRKWMARIKESKVMAQALVWNTDGSRTKFTREIDKDRQP